MLYFASGANETGHTAKVVARQRTSKKTGRPHVVNTHMRVKPAAPLVLNGEIFYTIIHSDAAKMGGVNCTVHAFSSSALLLQEQSIRK